MPEGEWRLSLRGAAVALAVIALTIYALSIILHVDLEKVLASTPPWILPLCVSAYVAGEAVRAVRLGILVEEMTGCRTGAPRSLTARLSGNLIALLTPSIGGGEAVRGALACPEHAGRSAVVGVLDGGIDLVANYLIAAAGLPLLAVSGYIHEAGLLVPGLLIASPVFAAWSLALGSRRVFNAIVSRAERLPLVSRWLKGVASLPPPPSLPLTRRVEIAFLSVVGWILNYAEILPLQLLYCGHAAPACIIGFIASFLAGVLPTPGGVGTVDYYMSLFICPEAVITWRIIRTVYIAGLGAVSTLAAAGKLVKRHDE